MPKVKSLLKLLLRGIETGESLIGVIGLLLVTLLIFAQVVNRYWLHFEIMWLGEQALFLFIFFMFVAIAQTTWKEGHVAVDILRERITRGNPTKATIYHASLVILSIVVLGVLLPIAYQFMLRALKYPEYGTLARWFNTSWLQITLFFALALVLLHLLVIAGRDITKLIRTHGHNVRKDRT